MAARSTGSGTSSFCDSSAAGEHLVAQLLVQNPLVQRVLVDDFDAGVGFDDQVAIVNLQCACRDAGATRRGRSLASVAAESSTRRSRWPTSNGWNGGTSTRCSRSGPRRNGGEPLRVVGRTDRQLARCWPELLASPNRPVRSYRRRCASHRRRSSTPRQLARRLAAGREIGRQKLRPQRAEQLAVQPAAVLEADFLLRRMDVHVDHLGRHVEPQEADRLPAREQQAAIRFAQRVLQRPVADRPAVEKQVLHPAGRPGCASGWRRSRRA